MQFQSVSPQIALASWARNSQATAIQEMLALTSRPGILSFALGLPAPELFPVDAYMQAAAKVVASDPRALQYGPPSQRLKAHIVALMKQRGIICREEQVFLTTGAQQGMNLLVRLLLDVHGTVLVEDKTYSGILQAIEPYQPTILTVPTDAATGMDIDAVAVQLKQQPAPAFIYAISDGHNPLGISLSLEKRQRLVELARCYHVPIIEDDPYGLLWYDHVAVPPMRALDEDWVFYVGSFSKILAPALRVGWLLAPEVLMPQLAILKEASDINTATFTQRIIAAYLDTGHLAGHLIQLRQTYQARRDTMLRLLHTSFPSGARWFTPNNGMFIWVELPQEVDTGVLLKTAIEKEGIAFIPGHAFGVGGDRSAAHCMRLNFSHCNVTEIEEGMKRLVRLLSYAF